jgi:N-succinyldiaminopimelate aminotransferase
MHARLPDLQPYPFERLRALLAGVAPPDSPPLRLPIGEPQFPTPAIITEAIAANLGGLSVYPLTAGQPALREAIAAWFCRRYGLPSLDPGTEVLPVNGSREALFAFAQAVVDQGKPGPIVVSPNPFYQIYEGAAVLAGAAVRFLNQAAASGFALDLGSLSDAEWRRTQLLYVCSLGNPTGHVLDLDTWRELFVLADRYGFVIASDECYSEIYPDEARPPLGGLEAAHRLGRTDFRSLVVFTSLSKRSNAPGLRSGAVAGDAALLKPFLLYRTYHGSAMSETVQQASVGAWRDETHVVANRSRYRASFEAMLPVLAPVMDVYQPDAGFYIWAGVRNDGGAVRDDDTAFARELFRATHVTVLPGQFLAREAHGAQPGRGRVRMALVAGEAGCAEAAQRIAAFCRA